MIDMTDRMALSLQRILSLGIRPLQWRISADAFRKLEGSADNPASGPAGLSFSGAFDLQFLGIPVMVFGGSATDWSLDTDLGVSILDRFEALQTLAALHGATTGAQFASSTVH